MRDKKRGAMIAGPARSRATNMHAAHSAATTIMATDTFPATESNKLFSIPAWKRNIAMMSAGHAVTGIAAERHPT